jgi:HEAT repeat protein
MHILPRIIFATLVIFAASSTAAQDTDVDESEELKIAALEALMAAPADRALPLVTKVLTGNHSDEVKSRALFVLSQIDNAEAQSLLLETARTGNAELKNDAIRMIGISGDPGALAGVAKIYSSGDAEVRESVMDAYLIADDSNAVYQIAVNTTDDEEFDSAVNILGVMGASEELKKLRDHAGASESLIHAYAMSDDFASLHELAVDGSDPERQLQAIQALGIVGGGEVDTALIEIYRGTDSEEIKDAALNGMMIADYDEGVLELYRSSKNSEEKQSLLRMLVLMDSDAAMDAIDSAFDGGQ